MRLDVVAHGAIISNAGETIATDERIVEEFLDLVGEPTGANENVHQALAQSGLPYVLDGLHFADGLGELGGGRRGGHVLTVTDGASPCKRKFLGRRNLRRRIVATRC